MTVVIVCQGLASGQKSPSVGQYLKRYDANAMNGRGVADWTHRIEDAMTFGSMQEALRFAHQTSSVRPNRPDGKANRPLTAFHLEFIRSPADKKD